jgi:hypothetical protein
MLKTRTGFLNYYINANCFVSVQYRPELSHCYDLSWTVYIYSIPCDGSSTGFVVLVQRVSSLLTARSHVGEAP